MTNVDPEVLELINTLAENRFALQVELDDKNNAFKAAQAAATAAHNGKIAPIQEKINEVDVQLAEAVAAHRDQLIGPKRKSFATMVATFQFKTVTTKLKIVDTDGLMAAARKLGIVRRIARLSVSWKPELNKLVAWLAKHGEYRMVLDDFVDGPTESESLSMKPNGTYTVVHDGNRISPPPVTIKKS